MAPTNRSGSTTSCSPWTHVHSRRCWPGSSRRASRVISTSSSLSFPLSDSPYPHATITGRFLFSTSSAELSPVEDDFIPYSAPDDTDRSLTPLPQVPPSIPILVEKGVEKTTNLEEESLQAGRREWALPLRLAVLKPQSNLPRWTPLAAHSPSLALTLSLSR
jgi:hypothetical protein